MATTKVRKVEGHRCSLPLEEDLITLYISGGPCVKFRRKFREYLMVSPRNPESRAVFKSTAQIREEESRHLRKYYHMIHPFSSARISWEMVMIVVYAALLIFMPLELGKEQRTVIIIATKFFLDLCSMADIVLFFCTGYYSVRSNKVVMKRWLVCKHYLFPMFIFDLLSSLPYNMFIYISDLNNLYWLKYFYLFKLCRLPTFIEYLKKFCIRMELYSYKLTTINFAVWFLTAIWWATNIRVAHRDISGDQYISYNGFDMLIHSCYEVVKAFMLVELPQCPIDKILALIFVALTILIGCMLNMVILAQVMQVYQRTSSSTNKYNNLIQEIGEYMKYKELPPSTRAKVFRYVEFKFQRNVFKEGDIVNTLSHILKQDILLNNCKRMVEKVELFKDLPGSLIIRLVTKLKSEIYLPNDVIVTAGIIGNAMYFIYVGSVAVYTKNEREICHLDDGSYFGEISLLINEPRVASVVAITNCELLKLSRKDFLEVIEPYPSLMKKIRKAALTRLTTTQEIDNADQKRISIITL